MRFAYVLCESMNQGTFGQWYQTKRLVPVDPLDTPMEKLKRTLRPWALDVLATEHGEDGWYVAFLVELTEDDKFDTYNPIHVEDILWAYECEYVPAR